MEVKVTTSKKDELKKFWRTHKKKIVFAGAIVAYVGFCAKTKKEPELTKEQFEEVKHFLMNVVHVGEGSTSAYLDNGFGDVKVGDLGRLGEAMIASLGSYAPDTEVVGVVVYTK